MARRARTCAARSCGRRATKGKLCQVHWREIIHTVHCRDPGGRGCNCALMREMQRQVTSHG